MTQTSDVFADMRARIVASIDAHFDAADMPVSARSAITVEPPKDASHGDMATNAAMVLAKPLKKSPREIATAIAARLETETDIQSIDVAGPGFINISLDQKAWHQALVDVLHDGLDYGRDLARDGQALPKTNVEYVSANPTGPMHVGHCRGAVVGDAVANMLAFVGYDVTREYYINDAGAQVDTLARSAFLRYREALGEDIGDIPSGLYPGDYLKPVGEALAEEHGAALKSLDEAEWLPVVRDATIGAMIEVIKDDLARLNVRHDLFFSEKSLQTGLSGDRVAQALETLEGRDLVYVGRLEKPKGEQADDWEDREQTLFRSTAFGDDVDRALLKSDGSYTYFASDIAYHYDKYLRGFTNQINVFGADHGGYVKRMKAAVAAISDQQASLEILLCQLVKLYRGGEPVRMSKRSGDFVTLRDVVDEVGSDAVRFMMLYRKSDAPLDFDFEKVAEQSKDNPVFYVQYAHARCASVARQAEQAMSESLGDPKQLDTQDLAALSDAGEIALIRAIASWPRVLRSAYSAQEPHRLAFYLYDLASTFHSHWNRGNSEPHLRFIKPDDPSLTKARVALVAAVKQTVGCGLGILGVSAPEEMR